MPDTDTQFQRVITTFLLWEAATGPNSDPEAAESKFLTAMRTFITPEIEERFTRATGSESARVVFGTHSPIVTSTQRPEGGGVQLQGQLYDFPVDLAALMAEGWTSIHSLNVRVQGTPCVVLESRSMSDEEAEARALYERLKLRFEGR